jgi:hypothetical protein
MKGRTGANTGSIFVGRRAARKDQRRRDQEDARWQALAGPVTITFDESVRRDRQSPEGQLEDRQ